MGLPMDEERAPYLLAADALREEISSGRWAIGERLPSTRELQERFAISHMTVRSALRVLRDEGLVYSVPGRGSFVRSDAAASLKPNQGMAGPVRSVAYEELVAQIAELRQQVQALADTVAQLRPAAASGQAQAHVAAATAVGAEPG